MPEIRLHPSARLFLDPSPDEQVDDPGLAALRPFFDRDWREGLLALAADARYQQSSLSVRFWREIAADYLARVCHLPDGAPDAAVAPPDAATCEHWCDSAPPLAGGEYLTAELLAQIWIDLAGWGAAAMAATGGPTPFLAARAPAWRRVGRVTFHLAENRKGSALPFAFMASFTTGLDAHGRTRHLPLHRALEMYAGAGNRAALVKLLSPVHEAAQRLDWVRALVDSGEVYRPMAWSAARARELLGSLAELDAAGLVVRLPDWWRQTSRPQVTVTIGQQSGSLVGADAILDFDVAVTLDGEPLTAAELDELLAGDDGLALFQGRWIEVDRRRLQEALAHWEQAADNAGGGIPFGEGMRLLAGAPADLRDATAAAAEPDWAEMVAGEGLRELLASMRDPSALDDLEAGEQLAATLRPYQKEGVAWLRLVTGLGLGACLADDMGLGKTLQVLALLSLRKRQRDDDTPPSLLVVPASLLGNWRAEANRFTPDLKLFFLHPSLADRATLEAAAARPDQHLAGCDLVVTTYGMTHRLTWLAEQPWDLVILDEAQATKNHGTRQSKAARRLPARARVALTGTPIENSLGDLWSLFDFLNPGLLGSARVFKDFVKALGRREHAPFEPLRRLVSPYILRRLKTDRTVISDLPDKTETVRYCGLSRAQARHYQQVVTDLERALRTVEQGVERRGLVLAALMRLKQVCNHPSQLTGDGEYAPAASGKFARLEEIGAELAARQEKVLVFTQFREIIPALEAHLAGIYGRAGLILHGGTAVKARAALVDRFQTDEGPPFLVASLKAGGTGLNLTAASHVIHFDRWWNPAVENQATDRAFRIGQRRNVLVHKFVTTGTIEESIDRLIEQKKELADQLLGGAGEIKLTELADDELLTLVQLDVNRALS